MEDIQELQADKTGPEIKAMYQSVEESVKRKLGITESKTPPAKEPNPYTKTSNLNEDKNAGPKELPVELRESKILSRRYANTSESKVIGKSRIEHMNEHFSR